MHVVALNLWTASTQNGPSGATATSAMAAWPKLVRCLKALAVLSACLTLQLLSRSLTCCMPRAR